MHPTGRAVHAPQYGEGPAQGVGEGGSSSVHSLPLRGALRQRAR